MRLIDADAVLDKMQDYGEGQERLMLIDPYWVRTAPTLERPQWIPCSERLPSYSERIVLATVVRRDKTWNNDPYHRLVTYTNGKWYPVPQSINLVPCRMATIEQSDGGQAEVIAWMPLPEPYKKEGDPGVDIPAEKERS